MDHRNPALPEWANPHWPKGGVFDGHIRAIGFSNWDAQHNPRGYTAEPHHKGQPASITTWDDPAL